MVSTKLMAASLLSCALLPAIANADVIYQSAAYGAGDPQNFAFSATPLNGPLFPSAVGESFTLTNAATITDLDFYIDGFDSNQTIQVLFHKLSDNPSINSPLFSQTFSFLQYTRTEDVITGPTGNTDNINFVLSGPLALDAGSYAVLLSNPLNTNLGVSRFGPNPGCSGSDCEDYANFGNTQVQINAGGQSISNTGYASGMRLNGVNNQVAAVPVPAAVWLFASGLPVVFGFSRRRKIA